MLRFVLTLFLLLQTAYADSCPKHYSLWQNGKCYRVLSERNVHFHEAVDLCSGENADLPSMHSADEAKNLFNSASNIGGLDSYWIGLRCLDADPALVWTDGSNVDYTPSDFPDECSPRNGPFYYQEDEDTWETGNINDNYPVICQKNVDRSAPSCDDFTSVGSGMCLELESAADQWHSAEDSCQQRAAHLASIHTKTENDFMRRSAVAHGFTSGAHIGLRTQFGQWNYSWIDGSPSDYTNFQHGYPDGGKGDCFAMDTDGTWKNEGCRLQLPYFCSRPTFDPAHPITAPGKCPTDALYLPGDVVFTPGYPAPGPMTGDCELSITAPGQKAQIQVITFEMNACCDSLTVYNGNTVLKVLTGEIAANTTFTGKRETMRLKYHSTSGAGVRGFHLKVNGV